MSDLTRKVTTVKDDNDMLVDEQLQLEEEMTVKGGAERISFPQRLFAYIKFGYDKSAKDYFNLVLKRPAGPYDSMGDYIDAVMTHVQSYYEHVTLTTKVEFKVIDYKYNIDLHHYIQT